uniref:Uncharacterized protein n=1 Tax=Plectus sambesii TaxID=2011161 RepID=A0A914V282_9BILA
MDGKDEKEDKMTEFRTGMALLQNANTSLRHRGRLTRDIPIASLLALVISLAGCLAFCVLFHYALNGFYRQVSELIPIHDFVPVQSVNIAIGIIFSLMAVIYFIVGTISTKNMRNNVSKERRLCVHGRTFVARNCNLLAIMTGVTYISVILWVHIFAVTSIATVLYVIFITATTKVCLLFDGKCINFSNLEPLIKPLLPPEVPNISLNFCEAKRLELCQPDQNLLSLFIVANAMCLLALISLIHFLMCMVANWKEQAINLKKVQPADNIADNLERVDLDSDGRVIPKRRMPKPDKGRFQPQRQDTVELLEDQLFQRRRQEQADEIQDPNFLKRLDSVIERYEDHKGIRKHPDEAKTNL